MKDIVRFFKALGDETRLEMLALTLEQGELCVCDFEQVLEIGQSKASRHLRHLATAGILDDRREAVWVNYRIADDLEGHRRDVVTAAGQLVPEPRRAAMAARLESWLERKASCVGQGCCSGAGAQGDDQDV